MSNNRPSNNRQNGGAEQADLVHQAFARARREGGGGYEVWRRALTHGVEELESTLRPQTNSQPGRASELCGRGRAFNTHNVASHPSDSNVNDSRQARTSEDPDSLYAFFMRGEGYRNASVDPGLAHARVPNRPGDNERSESRTAQIARSMERVQNVGNRILNGERASDLMPQLLESDERIRRRADMIVARTQARRRAEVDHVMAHRPNLSDRPPNEGRETLDPLLRDLINIRERMWSTQDRVHASRPHIDISQHTDLLDRSSTNEDCPICYDDEIADAVFVRTRVCHHVFHRHCLEEWANTPRVNSNTCPTCRTAICPLGGVSGHERFSLRRRN